MASVFKRGGMTTPGFYYASWRDHDGRTRSTSTRTRDKATAQRIANKLEADAELRRSGVIDVAEERIALSASQPIDDHIADFRIELASRGNTPVHVDQTIRMIKNVAEACQAHALRDVTSAGVRRAIADLREAGRAARTCNSYLGAMKSFSKWLWQEERLKRDPLAKLKPLRESDDKRLRRRALSPEESAWLLDFVAGRTLETHNLVGPDRAMLYRLALGTGLRRTELQSLRTESFDLEAAPQTVTVAAAYSKRRREDVVPLRDDLVEVLRPWLAARPAGEPVFTASLSNSARMLRADLLAAREAWIESASTPEEQNQREES